MQTYIFCKQVPLVSSLEAVIKWIFHSAPSVTFSWSCLSYCSTGASSCCPSDPLLSITLLSSAFNSPCPGAFFPWSGSYLWLFHSPWVLEFTFIPKGLATNSLEPGWGLWTHLCFVPPYCCWVTLVASLLVLLSTYDTSSTRAVLVLCYLSILSLQAGCSFTIEGHPVSLWAIFFSSEVFLNAYPFKLKEYWMLLLLHILSFINILQGSSRDLILVIGI